MASSSPSLSGGTHVSQPPTPRYRCGSGEWKRGMWSGKRGWQITPPLRTLHSTHVSGGCRRQEVGLESSCLVRLPQGGHFTAPRHMKCWLVFASNGEARDKWRGRQMSGERRGRETTRPTSSHQAAQTAEWIWFFGKSPAFFLSCGHQWWQPTDFAVVLLHTSSASPLPVTITAFVV